MTRRFVVLSSRLARAIRWRGRTQPNVVQQALNVTGRGSVLAWPGRGDIHFHEADNPGIGTPSVCRIRKMLSISTNAVPSNAAMWVSRLFAN